MFAGTSRNALLAGTGLLLTAGVVLAAGGDLDPAFGTGGITLSDGGTNAAACWRTVVQPDGKTLVGGYDEVGTTSWRWRVRRYDTAGLPDAQFGTGGSIALFGTLGDDHLDDLALDASGRVVAVGSATFPVTTGTGKNAKTTAVREATVVRLRPEGTVDTTFGLAGIATLRLTSPAKGTTVSPAARKVALQPDGRILVAGNAYLTSRTGVQQSGWFLARLTSNGAPDSTFGSNGSIVYDPSGGDDRIFGMALQADGRVLVGGQTGEVSGGAGWAIVRFSPAGAFDPSFTSIRSTTDWLRDLTVDSSDRILGVGYRIDAPGVSEFLVARYTAGGTPDTSFGSGGSFVLGVGGRNEALSIALQADGKVVFSGASWPDGSLSHVWESVVVRLDGSGALDPAFGSGGIAVPLALATETSATGIAVDPSGRIVVSGTLFDSVDGVSSFDWFVARYLGN